MCSAQDAGLDAAGTCTFSPAAALPPVLGLALETALRRAGGTLAGGGVACRTAHAMALSAYV